MTEWKEIELGEVCELLDCLHKTPTYSEDGYPMVRVTDVKNGFLNTSDCLLVDEGVFTAFSKGYKPKIGDIVFTRVGSFGLSAIVKKEEKFCIGQNTTLLLPKKINPFFLYYFLIGDDARYQIEGLAGGSTQPTISMANIRKTVLPFPNENEQRAIASILSGLDDKIDLLHRQNKTLEEIAETLFKQWFVFNASEEWKVKKLEEILSVTSSKRIFYKEYIEKGIPFYRSKEIIELSKGGSTSTELFISEERFNEISSKYGSPKQGDILLTSVGTLGVSYRVRKKDKFYFKDGNLTWFSNFKDLPGILIYCWLNSSLGKEELNNITIGSTQPALTIAGLRQIEIKIPPQKIIKKLENELNTLYSKIDFNQIQNHTLEKLRDTLLPKLMNGEVKVLFDELKKEIV